MSRFFRSRWILKSARKRWPDYIEKYPSMDGLVALGPIAAEPALQALDQAEKVGKIKVCVFDISPVIVEALVKKQVEFAIDQQEWLQGYLPVVFLANYVQIWLHSAKRFDLDRAEFRDLRKCSESGESPQPWIPLGQESESCRLVARSHRRNFDGSHDL